MRTGQHVHTCAPDSTRAHRTACAHGAQHTRGVLDGQPHAQLHCRTTNSAPACGHPHELALPVRISQAWVKSHDEGRGARRTTSTSILGRRTVPCSPVFIPNSIPHGFTQDPSTDQSSFNLGADRDYWFNPISKDRTWVDPHDPEARAQNAAVQARPSPFRTRSNTCDAHRVETGPYFRTRITT